MLFREVLFADYQTVLMHFIMSMAVALLFKEMNWFPFVSYTEKWNFDETAPFDMQLDRLEDETRVEGHNRKYGEVAPRTHRASWHFNKRGIHPNM